MSLDDAMVLFDWNGTVVIDGDRARAALNGVLERRKLCSLDEVQFSQRFRLPMGEMFLDLGVAENSLIEAEVEWNAHMASARTRLRAGAAEALASLHNQGVWLGIVSAASKESVDFDRETLEVPPVFSSVQAPIVDKAAALVGHRSLRTSAYYIGDTAYDMRSALAAGYTPIGVAGGYAPVDVLWEAGAAHVIEDLLQLEELLRASVMSESVMASGVTD